MIKIYAINAIQYKNQIDYERYLTLLEPERLKRIQQFAFYKDRLFCALSGLLLQYVSRYRVGLKRSETVLHYNPQGKPFFSNSPFQFSISHSGNWLLCAWGEERIGIDVEKIETLSDHLDIANHFFHPEEYRMIRTSNQEKQLSLFYQIWTAKESYVKYSGEGLSCPLSSFRIERAGEELVLSTSATPAILHTGWLDNEHPYALCSQDQETKASITVLPSSEFLIGMEQLLEKEA